MIGKIIVLVAILLLVVFSFKIIGKIKSKKDDDIVELKKDKDGKYKK